MNFQKIILPIVFLAVMGVMLIVGAVVAVGSALTGGESSNSSDCAQEEGTNDSGTISWPLVPVAHAADDCVGAEGIRGEIVRIAKKEVGYKETPVNIVKYFDWNGGAAGPWCSVFASWAWKEAGVKIDNTPYCGNFVSWSSTNGKWKQGTNNPQPGDAVLYGTGGLSENAPATCDHIGIVESVKDGKITTIEGNFGDGVTRRGPFDPKTQNAPAPIMGFASPVKD